MILPSARRKNRYLAVQKIGRPHLCFKKCQIGVTHYPDFYASIRLLEKWYIFKEITTYV